MRDASDSQPSPRPREVSANASRCGCSCATAQYGHACANGVLSRADFQVYASAVLPMATPVVFGDAVSGIERRGHEERFLCDRDRTMYVAVADDGTRAQLFGNELEITFNILPRQRRGGGHHGGKLSIS
jgi:hypothetical protein